MQLLFIKIIIFALLAISNYCYCIIIKEPKMLMNDDYYTHPNYKFDYLVKDPHTGDNKNQWEHRNGHKVKGIYEFYEPDGTKRIVEYNSDKDVGFTTKIMRVGYAKHPQIYGHQDGLYVSHGEGKSESYVEVNLYH